MRIIHTADWHLCDRLKQLDRGPDLEARVRRVAELCEEHQADVLLIAGDLFCERATLDEMTQALRSMHAIFGPFFQRGGTILAITGNHDLDSRIDMVRIGMRLAVPEPGRLQLGGGRMYLVNGRSLATLTGADGTAVQFVLVPYPSAYRYDLSTVEYRSKDQENTLLHGKVAQWVQEVPQQAGFNARLPTVLAAHLSVRGAEVNEGRFKLDERYDVMFDFADLNPGWAYVALGHIHKPQALGAANVRYAGSLDRLDFGDTHDGHGVLLIDVGPAGLRGEPVHLPLPATPFHTITLADPEADLPTLAERYPDHATAIVRITVHPSATLSRDEIGRSLRKLFPRSHDITFLDPHTEGDDTAPAFTPQAGYQANVRSYLERELAADPDREALVALAEGYLHDGGNQ